jgi:alpha-mannosidase
MQNPETWHEEAGAILKIKPQSLGGHYAEKICRLDWIVLNHFADMSDAYGSIAISNRDAFFMKAGNSTVTELDYTIPQIRILAAGQIDAPNLGIADQDGDSYFENFLALKPGRDGFSPASAMKFSFEHQNPLVAGRINNESSTPGSEFSLFTISDPDILVWSVKPSEEGIGNGIIMRLWNLDNHDKNCTISCFMPIVKCWNTTHIETDISEIIPEDGKLKINIGHNRIQTYRIFLK